MLKRLALSPDKATDFEITDRMVDMTKPNFYLKNLELQSSNSPEIIKKYMFQAAQDSTNSQIKSKLSSPLKPPTKPISIISSSLEQFNPD